MPPTVTVLLASTDVKLSDAVEAKLAVTSEIQLVSTAQGIKALWSALRQHQPGILAVDLAVAWAGSPSLLAGLRNRGTAGPRVLTIDDGFDERRAVRIARAGAHGYLSADTLHIHLTRAIRRLAQGETWFSRKLEGRIVDEWHRLLRVRNGRNQA